MIEQTSAANTPPAPQTQRVLRMVKHERMGGSVPVWETVEITPQSAVEQKLAQAQNGGTQVQNFETAMAYQQMDAPNPANAGEDFGFGDLIDMINPLHHIPLVGHAYRSITGDEIKPIGQIIGGAVFGGPLGAGVGLVNTVVEEETGKSVTGNAYAMLIEGDMPELKSTSNDPERALSAAMQTAEAPNDLPAALLAFTPPAYETGFRVERAAPVESREPVTRITLRPMPDRHDFY